MQQARALVAADFERVNQCIIDKLHSRVPMVENIGHYIIDAGGKRLRPMLVLLSAGALGYRGHQHIQLAAVIEFLHTATLLHDDVVDMSSLRRGRPTANAEFGNAPSVLVGDFIYSRAFQMLVELGDMDIMRLISDTTNTIAEGEVLQLTKAGDPDTDLDAYLQVITTKTAVLFGAATQGAAILADSDPQTAEQLYQYGLHLGIAFQLIDDVLDYSGDPAEMGKNLGDDLAEGKPTLPLIHTMHVGTPEQADRVRQAILNKDASQLDQIAIDVKACGALDYTYDMAVAYSDKALANLSHLAKNDYTEQMARLAKVAVDRRA
ncbi:MAG TPA: polyprenyl synthetase family protein [Pseudomonadales bacterium]|nr:polyprenyl synthetase family protein [Pseudomonadales bacterium]